MLIMAGVTSNSVTHNVSVRDPRATIMPESLFSKLIINNK
jgi:hypothetical protein